MSTEIYYFSGSGNSLHVAKELQKRTPACLNYCPAQAVQIKDKWFMKSYTANNGRYSHPYATADDIAAQKRTE